MLALVVGTGRNGTTLVQEVLSRHPRVGFISSLDERLPRLNLSGRYNGLLYRWTPQHDSHIRAFAERMKLLDEGRLRLTPSEAHQLLDRYVMPGFTEPCRDLVESDLTPYVRQRLVEFFEVRMKRQRCQVFLQHLTGWPRTGMLRAAFPDLRVINVIRDGRAVVNSLLQTDWWDGWKGPQKWRYGPLPEDLQAEWEASGRSFVVLAALGWITHMRAYERAREAFPADQWLDLRYEEIVADPRSSFGEALKFLGLQWSDTFEAGYARHQVVATRRDRFLTGLTASQLADVERVLAGTLRDWGYHGEEHSEDSPSATCRR